MPDVVFCCLSQEKRLRDRQTETEESLQKRLEAARIDMELSKFCGGSAETRCCCKIIHCNCINFDW